MATDSATYNSFGGTIVITKALLAANASNIATSQTPAANTPLTLDGTTGGVLDTQRRVLVTAGSEASDRTIVLTGLNSQGAIISETIAIPASSAAAYPSQRDYLVVTSMVSPLAFTNAVTVGTNGVGSTQPIMPAGYQAFFNIGFQVSCAGDANATIEVTRDIPYAVPQPYVVGFTFEPPILKFDAWTTLAAITASADGVSDVDSRVTAWRATINSGTGLVTVRATATGLRT
jgi:hypothetical protein